MEVLKLETWERLFDPEVINLDKVQEYLDFIVEARDHYDPDRYSEWHHVMPKCIDKNHTYDSQGVRINGRDHFLAHKILMSCFSGILKSRLSYALLRMSMKMKNSEEITEEEYEICREMYRKSISGEGHPLFGKPGSRLGKKSSLEHRRKISSSLRGKVRGPLSESHKLNISESLRGREVTDIFRDKMSQIRREYIKENGYVSPMEGKHFSEESKRKMSESAKGRFWITNGQVNRHVYSEDDIPEGWTRGFTPKRKKKE